MHARTSNVGRLHVDPIQSGVALSLVKRNVISAATGPDRALAHCAGTSIDADASRVSPPSVDASAPTPPSLAGSTVVGPWSPPPLPHAARPTTTMDTAIPRKTMRLIDSSG